MPVYCFAATIRTHHVEIKGRALAVALRVVPHAGVIAGALAIDPLQHQALVADYDALSDVMMERLPLKETRDNRLLS